MGPSLTTFTASNSDLIPRTSAADNSNERERTASHVSGATGAGRDGTGSAPDRSHQRTPPIPATIIPQASMGPTASAPRVPSSSRPIVQATQNTTAVASPAFNPRGCLNPYRAIPYEPARSATFAPAPSNPLAAIVSIDSALTKFPFEVHT